MLKDIVIEDPIVTRVVVHGYTFSWKFFMTMIQGLKEGDFFRVLAKSDHDIMIQPLQLTPMQTNQIKQISTEE